MDERIIRLDVPVTETNHETLKIIAGHLNHSKRKTARLLLSDAIENEIKKIKAKKRS